MVSTVGIFDENFYPVYFEDDDMALRLLLAGFEGKRFTDVALIHGNDRPGEYVSGTTTEVKKSNASKGFEQVLQRGGEAGVQYVYRKWGIPRSIGLLCNDMSRRCMQRTGHTLFEHPFNDSSQGLDFWKVNRSKRHFIVSGYGDAHGAQHGGVQYFQ
jgi:hypothetical protein